MSPFLIRPGIALRRYAGAPSPRGKAWVLPHQCYTKQQFVCPMTINKTQAGALNCTGLYLYSLIFSFFCPYYSKWALITLIT